MRAFEIHQRIFTCLYIHRLPDTEMIRLKKIRIFFLLALIFSLILGFLVSSIFLYKNFVVDLEEALYAVFQVAALVDAIYFLTSGYILRRKITKIFAMFQTLYDKSEFHTVFNIEVLLKKI